jgi:hypothetical protein
MDEMELLTRLRAEVPLAVSARAEERFLAVIRASDGQRAGARGATALARTAARMRNILRLVAPCHRGQTNQ